VKINGVALHFAPLELSFEHKGGCRPYPHLLPAEESLRFQVEEFNALAEELPNLRGLRPCCSGRCNSEDLSWLLQLRIPRPGSLQQLHYPGPFPAHFPFLSALHTLTFDGWERGDHSELLLPLPPVTALPHLTSLDCSMSLWAHLAVVPAAEWANSGRLLTLRLWGAFLSSRHMHSLLALPLLLSSLRELELFFSSELRPLVSQRLARERGEGLWGQLPEEALAEYREHEQADAEAAAEAVEFNEHWRFILTSLVSLRSFHPVVGDRTSAGTFNFGPDHHLLFPLLCHAAQLREIRIDLPLCVRKFHWPSRVEALRAALLAQPLLRAHVTLQHSALASSRPEQAAELAACAHVCRQLPLTSVAFRECTFVYYTGSTGNG
jgi:hypothetical protein